MNKFLCLLAILDVFYLGSIIAVKTYSKSNPKILFKIVSSFLNFMWQNLIWLHFFLVGRYGTSSGLPSSTFRVFLSRRILFETSRSEKWFLQKHSIRRIIPSGRETKKIRNCKRRIQVGFHRTEAFLQMTSAFIDYKYIAFVYLICVKNW